MMNFYFLLLQNGNGYHQYSLARVTFPIQRIETDFKSDLWTECDLVLHLSDAVDVSHRKEREFSDWSLQKQLPFCSQSFSLIIYFVHSLP